VHTPHRVFEPPDDPHGFLWRYMNLPKLVSLLDRRALWFSRADLLGDRHEGSFGEANARLRPEIYGDQQLEMMSQFSHLMGAMVRHTYVNCWHANAHESMAMWVAYGAAGDGVAVRTTFQRLTEALTCEDQVYAGRVRYVDPATEFIPENNTLAPYVHKRVSFDHEREVRLVIQDLPVRDGAMRPDAPSPPGRSIQVDLPQLVDAVFVAPGAAEWYRDAVSCVVNAIAPGLDVHQSVLDADPVY
jgi:hypothetical protein